MPVRKPRLDSQDIRSAGSDEETDPTALFEQAHVDPGPLRDAVRAALRRSTQATLAEIVTAVPLRQGLAELVAYLALRGERLRLEQEFISFASVAAARVISNDDFGEDWTTGRPGLLPSQLVCSKHQRDA